MSVYDKWVRIMPDFCSDGVWNSEDAAILAEDIPISASAQIALKLWSYCHDVTVGPIGRSDDQEAIKVIAEYGRRLAQAIKDEIPDWTIIYHDISKEGMKSDIEYEIFASGGRK
jgi:hypothetical protein